jgi:hypothetical protein
MSSSPSPAAAVTKDASPSAAAVSSHRGHHHPNPRWHGLFPRLAKYAKRSVAALSVVAVAGAYYEYKTMFPRVDASSNRPFGRFGRDDSDDEEKDGKDKTDRKAKRQVLVVPFHRIELKDRYDRDLSFESFSPDADDRTLKMEVRELVDLIHHAASDPSIVALYGIFGHGSSGLNGAGWADLEEVRNALKVFREAHRSHSEVT